MPILSLVLSRDGLGLPPLELSSDPDSSTYWLADAPVGGPTRAGFVVPRPRRGEGDSAPAPPPRTGGLELPLVVFVSGASAVELYAARTHLGQVLAQREFGVVVVRQRRETMHRAGASTPLWSPAPATSPGAGAGRTLCAHLRIPLLDGVPARAATRSG